MRSTLDLLIWSAGICWRCSCYRHGGAELVGTHASCLEVTATPVVGTINIDTNFLKVIGWSKNLIQATSDNGDPDHLPCAISEVTFNIVRSIEPGEAWVWCYVDEIAPGELDGQKLVALRD